MVEILSQCDRRGSGDQKSGRPKVGRVLRGAGRGSGARSLSRRSTSSGEGPSWGFAAFASVLLAWMIGVFGEWEARGAESAPVSRPLTNDLVTLEHVVQKLAALSNRTDMSVGVRTNVLALYAETVQRLADARRQVEETGRFRLETTNAPGTIRELQGLLEAPTSVEGIGIATNATVAELEQQIARTDADIAQATKEQDVLVEEPSRRAARLTELSQLISETRAVRDRIQQEFRAPQPAELDAEIRQANRDLLVSRMQYRDAELSRYEEEQTNLNATADVARLRLDLARRRLATLTRDRESLVGVLNRRREQESLQASMLAAQAARRAEALNEPWILQLAQTNTFLARERSLLAERLKIASSRLDTVTSNRLSLRDGFRSLRDRVDAAERAGLSRNYAIGLLLRRQQTALQGHAGYREEGRRQQGAISDAQIAQFAAVDARRLIEPVDAVAGAWVNRNANGMDTERSGVLLQESRMLLVAQRDLLAGLVKDYDTFLGLQFRLQAALDEAAGMVDEFAAYLDHRVLWIRSLEPIGVGTLRREMASTMAAIAVPDWGRVMGNVLREGLRSGAPGWALLVGTVLLVGLQGRLKRRLSEVAAVARQGRNTSLRPTFQALLYTGLRAAVVPVPLWGLGTLATSAGGVVEGMGQTLGPALVMAASILFCLGLLREICHPDGLAVAHFRMPDSDVASFRRGAIVGAWLLPGMGFLNRLLEGEFSEGVSNRLIFIPTVLVCAVLAHGVFRPKGGVGSWREAKEDAARAVRFWRRFVYVLVVGTPLLFVIASAMGYNYSARHLWVRFLSSILVAAALRLVSEFLFRGVYLTRRKLAMAHALRHRPSGGESGESPESTTVTDDKTQAVLLASMEQVGRLLNWAYGLALVSSLYGVWSGTLPAFQALDQIPVWYLETPGIAASPTSTGEGMGTATASGVLTGAGSGSGGTEGGSRGELSGAAPFVSVWDLLLVVLTLAVMVTAAANLPGFLEMAVFSQLKLERGTGYAITTTLRYAIILVGVILTAQGLGLEWSQVQWLAAAVTLGIGFGLQEIFANFVSGLILLVERPVRIGDVVTVGDVSGVVTRIQIRATTIRDWDNRELVLPNKELITGRFVNWTLSDSVTRLVCSVGISYDSDVRRAEALLLNLARRHPAVMTDPAPSVVFDGLGESTLNLSLRVHVAKIEQRGTTLFELNAGILEEFKKAGIEIAYPQRDLNVRLLPSDVPADQAVLRAAGSVQGPPASPAGS